MLKHLGDLYLGYQCAISKWMPGEGGLVWSGVFAAA